LWHITSNPLALELGKVAKHSGLKALHYEMEMVLGGIGKLSFYSAGHGMYFIL
jgi:hypothetical protein